MPKDEISNGIASRFVKLVVGHGSEVDGDDSASPQISLTMMRKPPTHVASSPTYGHPGHHQGQQREHRAQPHSGQQRMSDLESEYVKNLQQQIPVSRVIVSAWIKLMSASRKSNRKEDGIGSGGGSGGGHGGGHGGGASSNFTKTGEPLSNSIKDLKGKYLELQDLHQSELKAIEERIEEAKTEHHIRLLNAEAAEKERDELKAEISTLRELQAIEKDKLFGEVLHSRKQHEFASAEYQKLEQAYAKAAAERQHLQNNSTNAADDSRRYRDQIEEFLGVNAALRARADELQRSQQSNISKMEDFEHSRAFRELAHEKERMADLQAEKVRLMVEAEQHATRARQEEQLRLRVAADCEDLSKANVLLKAEVEDVQRRLKREFAAREKKIEVRQERIRDSEAVREEIGRCKDEILMQGITNDSKEKLIGTLSMQCRTMEENLHKVTESKNKMEEKLNNLENRSRTQENEYIQLGQDKSLLSDDVLEMKSTCDNVTGKLADLLRENRELRGQVDKFTKEMMARREFASVITDVESMGENYLNLRKWVNHLTVLLIDAGEDHEGTFGQAVGADAADAQRIMQNTARYIHMLHVGAKTIRRYMGGTRKSSKIRRKFNRTTMSEDEEGDGMVDLYAYFSIPKSATPAEIKRAYYRLCLKHHPDKLTHLTDAEREAATRAFQTLTRYHGVLSDPDLRAVYDETGRIGDDGDAAAVFAGGAPPGGWAKYFKDLWGGRVTEGAIDEFEMKYKDSADERADLLSAYTKHKGSMSRVLSTVPLSGPEDEDRFRRIVREAVDAGEAAEHKVFWKADPKASEKRKKKEAKERKEAAEEARKRKAGGDGSAAKEGAKGKKAKGKAKAKKKEEVDMEEAEGWIDEDDDYEVDELADDGGENGMENDGFVMAQEGDENEELEDAEKDELENEEAEEDELEEEPAPTRKSKRMKKTDNGMAGLQAEMKKRGAGRLESLIERLEGNATKKKKKTGGGAEPSEEEFQALQKKLFDSKGNEGKKEEAVEPKKGLRKRRR
ncbi:hypothetical protein HK101_000830 [Irineochytrium annulatum]|nr:hypothetical protein HK101_000830 [Irineochytrium annulatum]